MNDKISPINDEDKALFDEAMKGVTPLNQKEKALLQKPPVPLPSRRRRNDDLSDLKPNQTPYLSDYVAEPVDSEAHVTHQNQSVQRHQMQAFKKGALHIEARLDLHGASPENAKNNFLNFLALAYEKQQRCVLIIHGKGGKTFEKPIIKNLVIQWLKQIPYVLAFTTASRHLGGSGAVCVLLSRKKENLNCN